MANFSATNELAHKIIAVIKASMGRRVEFFMLSLFPKVKKRNDALSAILPEIKKKEQMGSCLKFGIDLWKTKWYDLLPD